MPKYKQNFIRMLIVNISRQSHHQIFTVNWLLCLMSASKLIVILQVQSVLVILASSVAQPGAIELSVKLYHCTQTCRKTNSAPCTAALQGGKPSCMLHAYYYTVMCQVVILQVHNLV